MDRYRKSMMLLERAGKIVPLASQTFSKSYMQWVKGAAPLFAERGEGARVWDVDGNEYIDYVLGLLPIVLGYCDPDVDAAIKDQLSRGIIFSLATELEAELAEELARLIPSAEMTRFGKNGSDVTTAAIRLARAYTGRDHVVVAGYHGWHDWYIGSTVRDLGVPAAVSALTYKVEYGDLEELEELFKRDADKIACFILEPESIASPPPGYLENVRSLCDQYGIVLVFDEIVTGFRTSLGGVQSVYGVVPDMSCFGKAMGNGMPISALVGKKEIMVLCNDIFFSTTFGGEALSLAAALATLRKMEALDVPKLIQRHGAYLKAGLNDLAESCQLESVVQASGTDWWPRLTVSASGDADQNLVASLLRQFFAESGLLLGATFNICLAHVDDDVASETMKKARRALEHLKYALGQSSPESCLCGERIQAVFSVR